MAPDGFGTRVAVLAGGRWQARAIYVQPDALP